MTEAERLIQRFVDQELSPEERIRFVARLGRDETLRRHAIDLEHVLAEASRLPAPDVPPGFVAGVLARTAPIRPAPSIAARWRAPRVLRWHLAGAAAAACLVLASLAGAAAVGYGWRAARPAAASASSTPVLVRLVVVDPGATSVGVAGDFNAWNAAETPLQRISDQAWAVTIALEPGRYAYMFLIDGQRWVADPFAGEQQDDGFGQQNAVLEIGPPGAPL